VKYPGRVSCGDIHSDTKKDNVIRVWGANASNWNRELGAAVGRGDDGQAKVIGAAGLTSFGIVTTPALFADTLLAEDKVFGTIIAAAAKAAEQNDVASVVPDHGGLAKEKAKQYAVAKGWLPSAVKELRARLELKEGEGDSKAIQKSKIPYAQLSGNGIQKARFKDRSDLYSASNLIGCGTTDYKEGQNYPFCHLSFTHDITEDGESVTLKPKKTPQQSDEDSPIAVVCIDYQDYRRLVKLPDSKTLTSNYKQKTFETLRAYNGLNVEHLLKAGDGMGVFLDRHNGSKRDADDITKAKAACLDGFFEALTEFYKENTQAKLQKITFVTIDALLVESFKVKLKAWQASDKNIKGLTIEADVSDMKFKAEECLAENPDQKLGITMAPNGNHEFLGGVLGW
jgi:hypothetical protein